MTFLYLDSSALVKRFIDEPHSEAVAHLMDETLAIGTSAISRVEVGAALARAARGNRLDADREQFADDWPDFGKVLVTDRLLAPRNSPGSTGCGHTLPYSLQPPSSARKTLTALDESVVFACFDDELTAAANDEGLRTWPD